MLDQGLCESSKLFSVTLLMAHSIYINFFRFDDINLLLPNGDALDVTFNVWDEGQDVAAASEVLKNQTWECELAFSINVPVSIMGQTDTIISQPGSSSGVFAITKFEGSGTNLQLVATCTSPESGRQVFSN